jgi:endonuclease/exonuclease/phosphatase family metal-dependent hydrolase
MKIMSFNTQHCKSYLSQNIDYEVMADAIKREDPDIVCLNEMRDAGEHEGFEPQTKILSELCGMEYFYFAKAIEVYADSSPYGNALLSKNKILTAETIAIPDPETKNGTRHYESRCILKAKLECGLTVLCVHIGLNPEEKENAIKTILKNLEDERCILAGDFNMSPEDDLLLPIKERLQDAAKLFSEPLLSIPSDVPTRKIDYIFATPDIKIISADIPATVASDHRPHTAEISF